MAFYDTRVAVLTPRKLYITQLPSAANQSTQSSKTTILLRVNVFVGYAKMAFALEDSPGPTAMREVTLQICISSHSKIAGYSIPVSNILLNGDNLTHYQIWMDGFPRSGGSLCTFVSEPLFGSTPATVSCLEGIWMGRGMGPMQFNVYANTGRTPTATGSNSRLDISRPYFSLSELEMPALYAESVRDYDDGLGLLVVGNVMGELALYSLSGGDLSNIQGCLQPVKFIPHRGNELLPTSPVPACPLRINSLDGGIVSEAEKQANLQFWQDHFPHNVPEGWSATNWFDRKSQYKSVGETFIEEIGEMSWLLDHAFHFLGRPIPLMYEDNENVLVLFKIHDRFFISDPYYEYGSVVAVIRPEVALDTIVARLAQNIEELQDLDDLIVNYAIMESSVDYSSSLFWTLYSWERHTHDKDRWMDFKERGGRIELEWPNIGVTEKNRK
ncbi:hypothetical protein BC835DRAFT_1369615 [Cytidiella melzeri]|nr:hypothetical protein BC835DRAFT_1369615 [Cytidiella melzeri]